VCLLRLRDRRAPTRPSPRGGRRM